MSGKIRAYTISLLGGVALAGCAGSPVPPPTDQVSNASAAIERAQQAGAHEFAALEITRAQRKLDQAKAMAGSDDEDERLQARRLAEQAAVEARLAEATARLAGTRNLHQELDRTVDTLRNGGTGAERNSGSEGTL